MKNHDGKIPVSAAKAQEAIESLKDSLQGQYAQNPKLIVAVRKDVETLIRTVEEQEKMLEKMAGAWTEGYMKAQNTIMRRNKSGCCCKWSEDEREIVSLCNAHKEKFEAMAVDAEVLGKVREALGKLEIMYAVIDLVKEKVSGVPIDAQSFLISLQIIADEMRKKK